MVNFRIDAVENGLALSGELDEAAVPLLRDAVRKSSPGSLRVLDLARMTFVDTAGLGGLLSVVRSEHDVRLINPNRTTLRAMVVAGVERELMNA